MIEFGVLFHTGIVRGKNEFLKARVRAAYTIMTIVTIDLQFKLITIN